MDAHGDFATEIDGSLTYESYLTFRAIVLRQAGRHFAPKKAELTEKKREAFRAQN